MIWRYLEMQFLSVRNNQNRTKLNPPQTEPSGVPFPFPRTPRSSLQAHGVVSWQSAWMPWSSILDAHCWKCPGVQHILHIPALAVTTSTAVLLLLYILALGPYVHYCTTSCHSISNTEPPQPWVCAAKIYHYASVFPGCPIVWKSAYASWKPKE